MKTLQHFLNEIKENYSFLGSSGPWYKHLGRFMPGIVVILAFGILAMLAQSIGWSNPKEGLLWVDMKFTYWILLLIFAVLCSLLIFFYSEIVQHIRKHRPSFAYVTIVFALACFAVLFAGGKINNNLTQESSYRIAPMHRVQSDEAIFLNVAQNMNHRHIAATCEEALMDKGMECIPGAKGHSDVDHLKLKSQALILSSLMPILGKNLNWIYHFQLFCLFSMIGLMGLALWLWTKEALLSLAALSLITWAPLTLFQFRSFSVEPLYLTLGALSMVLYHFAIKGKSSNHLLKWILLAASIGFWLHTRQETFFTLPAILLFALPAMHRDSLEIKWQPKVPSWLEWIKDPVAVFSAVLALAFVPIYCLVISYWGYDFQGGEFKPHGHFVENVRMLWQQMTLPHTRDIIPNVFSASLDQLRMEWNKIDEETLLTTPFLSSHAFLALLGIPALIWMAYKDIKILRWVTFLILFQAQAYMILENVSGDLGIEINQRYALVWLPFQALLGASFIRVLLLDLLPKLFPRTESGRLHKDSILVGLIVVLILSALTWRHQKSFKENILYNSNHLTNEEVMIHKWIDSQEPKARLFIYNRSLHFVAYQMSSLKMETWQALSPAEKEALLARFAGEVYYVRGLDCAENQNNHGKATGQDASDECSIFEASNGLQKVYEEMVLGTYPLLISKLGGSPPPSAPTLQILGVRPSPTGGLQLGVKIPTCPAGATLSASLNTTPSPEQICQNGIMVFEFAQGANSPMDLKVTLKQSGSTIYEGKAKAILPTANTVPLSIQPQNIRQAWYKPALGTNVMGKILQVQGTQYLFGWGTHADSHMEFPLGGQFTRFKSLVGLDDDEQGGDGAKFRVLGDGKVLWESKVLLHNQLDSFDIDISGVQTLILESDKGASDNFDHTDWLLPILSK